MAKNDKYTEHRQHLFDTVLNYLGEHHDGNQLYEMFHEEMGLSNEDIIELGFDLSEYFVYEWKPGDAQRHYAEELDYVVSQHNVATTTAWIRFAEELADGTESTFEEEAELLIAAFKEISEKYSPQAIAKVYETIHIPDNALLANEIVAAAACAEQGASVQLLSDMAKCGAFEGEPNPKLSRAEIEKNEGMNEFVSM